MENLRRLTQNLFPIVVTGISILILVISCRLPIGINSTPTFTPRNKWLTEWLEDPICQPPCFLDITPGITTITETVQLLSNIDGVQITRGPTIDLSSEMKELTWEFNTPTKYDGGRMITDKAGKTILTSVLVPGDDQSLKISEVIAMYGSPTGVSMPDCRGKRCVVETIYISNGMLLESILHEELDDNNNHIFDISPDLSVGRIWFFPPGEDGYKEAFGYLPDVLPWNGYTIYKER